MTLADAISVAIHLVFAGVWTGSVVLFSYAVLPAARSGQLNAAPLGSLTGKLQTISRACAAVLFLTGGHMAGSSYTVETLTGTGRGGLVLVMVGLWLLLAVLVELGASRLLDGTDADKVREPARNATRLFQGASIVAVLLLVVGGALAGNLLIFL